MGLLDTLGGNWNQNRIALAQALTTLGTVTHAPELKLGETLGGVTGKFGETLVPKAYAADNGTQQIPGVSGGTGSLPGQQHFGDLNTNNNNNGGNGGGNGGGGGDTEIDQLRKIINDTGGDPGQRGRYQQLVDEMKNSASSRSNAALEAALGVFEAKKQGIMNKIPYLQDQLSLRLRGLDEGLKGFEDTANSEESKRIAGLQQEGSQIGDTYLGAERKTRQAAKTMARTLRNMFAGAGSLDSTQYKDMNVDNSKEILQTMGDLGREKAGKITANTREQQDTSQFYSAQKLQEQKRVQLAKETESAKTDELVQGILDDAELTDAQKVEAVTQAQQNLDTRLTELDQQALQLEQQSEKDAADLKIKMAELSSKGTSADYKSSQEQRKALSDADSLLSSAVANWESINKAPASTNDVISIINGMPKNYRDYLMPLYFPDKKQLGGGTAGAPDNTDAYGAYLMQ